MKLAAANRKMIGLWQKLGTRYMPFADAASVEMPLARLLRLALFQISAGCVMVLLNGTLNRVMIVELGVPVELVSAAIAIPVLAAPLRLFFGYRSDTHRSVLGWRRVPYVWLGSLLQFGGLAIMPFALLLLQSQTLGPEWAGAVGACLAFMLTGFGMHMSQTAGLALASDLVPAEKRPRVVALLYVMLLVGMMGASAFYAVALVDFSPKHLIQVIQGTAVFTIALNVIAIWKQEARNPAFTATRGDRAGFWEALSRYRGDPGTLRLLLTVAVGSAAFSMQDILLEPYGGEILGMSVGRTTLLTGLWAAGAMIGFIWAAKSLQSGGQMYRIAARGLLIGITAFSAIILAEPLELHSLFYAGAAGVGIGGGLFSVGTLLGAMAISARSDSGMVVGAWGAVQATAMGCSLLAGGVIKNAINNLALKGALGEAMVTRAAGYLTVYALEILLLFVCLAAIGPLTGRRYRASGSHDMRLGLAEMPG
ncbi:MULTISPECIES: BCD family MFS transporter [unclassified Azospirillum]|uniref:BCD family MFS transporter n=1 Tax=unclassified Azospirillum TaxID=2630922 RepID=UPI000B71FA04|nr:MULTISPECIES: BCD family MFS transporter [unclassified Azospirillum]SNT02589.1 MFS transporter, BCD family, chlorophyll transporter [Azospirillum sp. RU38E]SNT18201.1 MFS transporter, BCD family, chlorophyll transporter [Azospirillum sp. RU37A]